MSKPSPTATPTLAELRAEIDRIDEAMHGLLMERGAIIENLIAVKKSQETGGSAFRPAREASMMRKLVERHRGLLPLDTVESIWRVIISTFTHVQSPYSVHADLTPGEASVRDSVRFHFGFTVPFVPHMSARGVIDAVAASKGDLGLVPATALAGAGDWWTALEDEKAPKIIARPPFVERPDHPASLPVFAVSRSAADAMADEVQVFSVKVSGWSAATARALAPLAEMIAVPAGAFDGASLLVSVPQGQQLSHITDALARAEASVRSSALVGRHATRYTVAVDKTR
jgi:chorismate mutase